MMKLMILLCALVVCQAKNLEDPAASLYGEYKLVYTWPKVSNDVPNCTPVVISRADPSASLQSCSCKRAARTGLISLEARSKKFTVLSDIVSSAGDLKKALDDSCSCSDGHIDHSVVYHVNDSYMIHYDTNISRSFLLSRSVPAAGELEKILEGLTFVDQVGSLVCR